MKKLFITAVCAVACALSAFAQTSTLIGSLVAVNNTSLTSSVVAVSAYTLPSQRLSVQNGGVAYGTNALVLYGQISVGDTNHFMTISQTYIPSATNAATEAWVTTNLPTVVYGRVIVTTTTNVNVGVILTQ